MSDIFVQLNLVSIQGQSQTVPATRWFSPLFQSFLKRKLTQTPCTYFMKQKQKRLIADIDDIFITDKILN